MYPHDNIFNIYYNIGKRTPFLVKRCELGLARSSSEERRIDPNRDRTFLVESVKPRGKYGKAYGKCFVDGKPDDSYRQECYPNIKDEEIPCAGCGEWVLIEVPGVSLDDIFPIHKADEVLMFGKYKGKSLSDIYKEDCQYLHWLESTDRFFKIDFEELKRLYHTWGKEMSERGGWSALFWNNHDQPRALNRFVDIKNFRNEGATMLAASINLSRGTPYIYMGEEIGMIDPDYDSMADYVDVESINAYQMLLDQGKSPEQAFQIIQAKSRDNSRTPMQWDASENAGFSTGTPWLKAGKSYKDINVENEIDGPIFTFYKELIRLRKEMPIISEGSYLPALEDSQQIYAFERHLDGQKLLVLNHFYGSEVEVAIPEDYQTGRVLLSNYTDAELAEKVILKPYQTLAILVK